MLTWCLLLAMCLQYSHCGPLTRYSEEWYRTLHQVKPSTKPAKHWIQHNELETTGLFSRIFDIKNPRKPGSPTTEQASGLLSRESNIEGSSERINNEKPELSKRVLSDTSQLCQCGIRTDLACHSPWEVKFYFKGEDVAFCSGTIISKKWIISAASCFRHTRRFEIHVSSQRLEADKVLVQELYVVWLQVNDVALVRLKEEVEFNERVQPVCLPYELPHYFTWAGQEIQILQYMANLTNHQECINEYDEPLYTSFLCIKQKESCELAGTPAVARHGRRAYLVGIAARNEMCRSYSIYAKLWQYLHWIEQTTGESFCHA